MPAALDDVHNDDAGFFKRQKMLGDARLPGAHGVHNVATGYWAAFLQEPDNFVAPSIAESLNGGFHIRGPSQIYRVRDLRHVSILPLYPQVYIDPVDMGKSGDDTS
ncbi:hypothetical protein AOC05_00195 [Arthrobacter alpinus]|uniref:Uncharacterized protein n=1 Tax=Arthrobacter alpinus TaxID=656366 RepID=A0A0M5LX37_9MICC|nr:hypothetical protein AOC05_00195 [Arthrobacter alpinus]